MLLHLIRMRNKSENTKTIETTFGQVTVFTNDSQDKKANSSKPPVKTSIEADSNADNAKKVDRGSKAETEHNDEDFFGIKKTDLNFFDQEIVIKN